MAEVPQNSSYPVPVAPDTSIDAYIREHPSDDSRYRRYLNAAERDALGLLDNYDLWRTWRNNYESWVNEKINRYNADMREYENWYNSPENSRSMLESAGYNINYLQGASGAHMDASEPLLPQASEGTDRSDMLKNFMDVYSPLMDLIGQVQRFGNLQADTDLKAAQAESFRVGSYYKALENSYNWYTDMFNGLPGNLVQSAPGLPSVVGPSGQSLKPANLRNLNALQDARISLYQSQMSFTNLSAREKKVYLDTMQPIEQSILKLQQEYLSGAITAQDFNNQMSETRTDIYKRFAEHEEYQKIALGWLDGVSSVVDTILDFFPKKTIRISGGK